MRLHIWLYLLIAEHRRGEEPNTSCRQRIFMLMDSLSVKGRGMQRSIYNVCTFYKLYIRIRLMWNAVSARGESCFVALSAFDTLAKGFQCDYNDDSIHILWIYIILYTAAYLWSYFRIVFIWIGFHTNWNQNQPFHLLFIVFFSNLTTLLFRSADELLL